MDNKMRNADISSFLALAVFMHLCCGVIASEFNALLEQMEPPARFADHIPQFSVAERKFTFQSKDGEWNWKFYVIKDGERYVGVMPTTGFHGGTIYMLTFNPSAAPAELNMPKERWHIDTAIGYANRTDQFIPDRNGSKEWNMKDTSEWIVAGDGSTLTLVRHFKGKHEFKKWEHRTNGEIEVDHTGTFVLSCDPVLGYVLTSTWDTGLTPGAPTGQYTSLMPPGLSNPWPWAGVCQRVALCPRGSDGYEGWALNGTAVDRAGGDDWIRNGGFGVFLDQDSGWSCTMTVAGGDAKLAICNVHADLDYIVQWPKDIDPDENGLLRHKVVIRMLAMPPELTAYVWNNMQMRYTGNHTVIFPLQQLEDFEEQPLTLDTVKRGFTFGRHASGDMITTNAAFSGTKSVRVRGMLWPNIPQIVLRPGVRYRLEAMMLVEPPDEGQLAAFAARQQAQIERRRADRQRRIEQLENRDREVPDDLRQPIPDYVLPEVSAEAYITAHQYEWTPHHGQWTIEQETNRVKAGDGWQKVSLEFIAPDWGPFVDIRFRTTLDAEGYMDDFFFGEVE